MIKNWIGGKQSGSGNGSFLSARRASITRVAGQPRVGLSRNRRLAAPSTPLNGISRCVSGVHVGAGEKWAVVDRPWIDQSQTSNPAASTKRLMRRYGINTGREGPQALASFFWNGLRRDKHNVPCSLQSLQCAGSMEDNRGLTKCNRRVPWHRNRIRLTHHSRWFRCKSNPPGNLALFCSPDQPPTCCSVSARKENLHTECNPYSFSTAKEGGMARNACG